MGQRYGIAEWAGHRRDPHPFSQASLFADIDCLLASSVPDILALPHPSDSNEDHRVVTALVLDRLRHLRKAGNVEGKKVELIWYLVHQVSRRKYPQPFGYHPHLSIWNPEGLPRPLRVKMTPEALRAKERALRSHRTQIRLRDGFLLSFIRSEEIYWQKTF